MRENRSRGERPRSLLRGERLAAAAKRELADHASWRQGQALSWSNLASRLGVSRQALEGKEDVVAAFKEAKAILRSSASMSPEVIVRRSLEEQICELQRKLTERERQLDAWVERWVQVEYNCRLNGYDADKIFAPFPKANRVPI